MIISTTEVQNSFGKYLELVHQEDIIITRNGKKVARLIKYYEGDDHFIRENSSAYSHEGMKVTYQEFLKISRQSDNRYEYIDGQIYLLASPRFKHQKAVIEISGKLLSWFKDKECQPLTSPFDVTLYKNEVPNVVQPDILVICDQQNIAEDGTYQGIPKLVVEVLSESTKSKDLIKKVELYMAGGVAEYWIVNPFSEEINIYLFNAEEIEEVTTYKGRELAESFIFPGLQIDLAAVFTSIRKYIQEEQDKGKVKDPLLEMVGLFSVDITDGSVDHDKYIYGVEKDEK